MRTERYSSTGTRQAEGRKDIGVRLVESPAHRSIRLRAQRKQSKRESRVMAVFCGVIGFAMTLFGLYVNEHCALNSRERLASRLAVDNSRLQDRIAALDSESDRLKMTMALPNSEMLHQMQLEYSKTPGYLGRSNAEAAR